MSTRLVALGLAAEIAALLVVLADGRARRGAAASRAGGGASTQGAGLLLRLHGRGLIAITVLLAGFAAAASPSARPGAALAVLAGSAAALLLGIAAAGRLRPRAGPEDRGSTRPAAILVPAAVLPAGLLFLGTAGLAAQDPRAVWLPASFLIGMAGSVAVLRTGAVVAGEGLARAARDLPGMEAGLCPDDSGIPAFLRNEGPRIGGGFPVVERALLLLAALFATRCFVILAPPDRVEALVGPAGTAGIGPRLAEFAFLAAAFSAAGYALLGIVAGRSRAAPASLVAIGIAALASFLTGALLGVGIACAACVVLGVLVAELADVAARRTIEARWPGTGPEGDPGGGSGFRPASARAAVALEAVILMAGVALAVRFAGPLGSLLLSSGLALRAVLRSPEPAMPSPPSAACDPPAVALSAGWIGAILVVTFCDAMTMAAVRSGRAAELLTTLGSGHETATTFLPFSPVVEALAGLLAGGLCGTLAGGSPARGIGRVAAVVIDDIRRQLRVGPAGEHAGRGVPLRVVGRAAALQSVPRVAAIAFLPLATGAILGPVIAAAGVAGFCLGAAARGETAAILHLRGASGGEAGVGPGAMAVLAGASAVVGASIQTLI